MQPFYETVPRTPSEYFLPNVFNKRNFSEIQDKHFYVSLLITRRRVFLQADVKKKICFRSSWQDKKTHPAAAKLFIFCQKLQFRYFLKQPCSFAYCSSFHVLTFFFISLHRNFNVTQQISILCIILKHTLKISHPQIIASKSYVFYEVEEINNFFSSLFTNFRL